MPAAIENIILRYVKSKAEYWTSVAHQNRVSYYSLYIGTELTCRNVSVVAQQSTRPL